MASTGETKAQQAYPHLVLVTITCRHCRRTVNENPMVLNRCYYCLVCYARIRAAMDPVHDSSDDSEEEE
jgi:hypothetical protein